MKAKYLFPLFIMSLFLSCKAKQHTVTSLDHIMIYDNYDGYGEMSLWGPPEILILKTDKKYPENNSYENYFLGFLSILGKWEMKNDTLYLFPRYEFRYDTLQQVVKIDLEKVDYYDEFIVNQKWLIKDDCIYDRSDYSVYNNYDKEWGLGKNGYRFLQNPNRYLRLRTKAGLQ